MDEDVWRQLFAPGEPMRPPNAVEHVHQRARIFVREVRFRRAGGAFVVEPCASLADLERAVGRLDDPAADLNEPALAGWLNVVKVLRHALAFEADTNAACWRMAAEVCEKIIANTGCEPPVGDREKAAFAFNAAKIYGRLELPERAEALIALARRLDGENLQYPLWHAGALFAKGDLFSQERAFALSLQALEHLLARTELPPNEVAYYAAQAHLGMARTGEAAGLTVADRREYYQAALDALSFFPPRSNIDVERLRRQAHTGLEHLAAAPGSDPPGDRRTRIAAAHGELREMGADGSPKRRAELYVLLGDEGQGTRHYEEAVRIFERSRFRQDLPPRELSRLGELAARAFYGMGMSDHPRFRSSREAYFTEVLDLSRDSILRAKACRELGDMSRGKREMIFARRWYECGIAMMGEFSDKPAKTREGQQVMRDLQARLDSPRTGRDVGPTPRKTG